MQDQSTGAIRCVTRRAASACTLHSCAAALFRRGCFLVLAVALLVLLARAARARIVAPDLGPIAPHRLGLRAIAVTAARCLGPLRRAPAAAHDALLLRRSLAVGIVLLDLV